MNIIQIIDITIYKLIFSLNSELLTNIMMLITHFASAFALIGLTILGLIFIKDKRISILMLLNLFTAFVLVNTLKFIFTRDRPLDVVQLVNETGYSFPSAHTMIGTAFYGFIIYLIYKNINNKKIKTVLITLLSLLIGLIAISRVYLGAHYFTDVFAGVVFGIIYLVGFVKLCPKIINNYRKKYKLKNKRRTHKSLKNEEKER